MKNFIAKLAVTAAATGVLFSFAGATTHIAARHHHRHHYVMYHHHRGYWGSHNGVRVFIRI